MEEVNGAIGSFEATLSEVEKHLQPLLQKNPAELNAQLDPLEVAKLELTLAYSVNSLFWMYLTTQGLSAKEYPVKEELERVRAYMKKIKEAEESHPDPNLRLNKDAAARFIKNAISDQAPAEESKGAGENGDGASKSKKRPKSKQNP